MEKFGESLVAGGWISPAQLTAALGEQRRWGHRLGETLVQLGFLRERDLIRVLAQRTGFPGVDLEGRSIAPELLALVPAEIAARYTCLPLVRRREAGGEVLYVAMEDPENLTAVDDLCFRTGLTVRPCIGGPRQLRQAIAACYEGQEGRQQPVRLHFEEPASPRGGDGEILLEERWREDLVEPEGLSAESPTDASPSGAVAAEDAKPRDVPTRTILRALTRLLIDKGIIDRPQLMAEIVRISRS